MAPPLLALSLASPVAIATAPRVALSKETFGANVGFAVIATGASFPDALAGAAAAGAKGGPVLLVERDRVPLAVTTELLRLSPTRLLVVGGPQAISDSVLSSLRITNNVERVAGNDRVETAADVSAAVFKPGVPVAFVATAWAFPDALAGAAAAGAKGGPVLLVNGNTVPDATRNELQRLRPQRIVALGGPGAVGDGAVSVLGSYAPRVDRLAGSDRYATAAAISTWAWPNGASQAYVASGDGFADALAAAAAGGATKRPLLLVPGGALPGVVASELDRLGVTRVALLGGATAVTDTVVSLLSGLAPPAPAPALGPYKFDSSTATGAPFRWNPCAPVPWVLNPGGVSAAVVNDLHAAFARLAAATGLQFSFEGNVGELPSAGRSPYQPSAYGARWAPVLVSFVRPGQTDLPIGGQTVGWTVVSVSGVARVSATVSFSSVASLAAGFVSGSSWGSLMLHELGHLAGLSHVDDKAQVMYPVIGAADYAAGDRAGLSQLGASRGCVSVPKVA